MAKKEETISLIDTFSEFKELKNIDRTTMVSVLEESFRSVIAKMFGTDENYDVIVNPDKGDFNKKAYTDPATRIRVTSKYGVIVKLWRMRTLKTRTCRFL